MPTTATINPKQETTGATPVEDSDNSDKPARRGNPLMRTLTPDMIREPHKLDFADGMMSNEFAWEKVSKQILEPLGITTKKEWMDLNDNIWTWHSNKAVREAEFEAEEILAKASENPLLLDVLKQKISQTRKAA